MAPIRALVFDDLESQVSELQFALKHEWEKFVQKNGEHLPPLEFTGISDRDRLREILNDHDLARKFDFFLCDIFVNAVPSGAQQLGKPIPEAEGYRFMMMAKEHGMPLCVGITRGDFGSYENNYRLQKKFEAYVDCFYFKKQLYGLAETEAPVGVVSGIVEILRSKGIIRAVDAAVKFEGAKQEARTLGILEEVTERTIGSFADRFALPGATSFELSSIAPGLSGAKILKITYKGSDEDYSTRPLLIKLSRDRSALLREIEAFRENIQEPMRIVQRIIAHPYGATAEPLTANGWHCIAFEFAAPSAPLLTWLVADLGREQNQIADTLHELFFVGGLGDLYSTTLQNKAGYVLDLVEEGLLSHYRRMAVLEAIETFQPLLDKYAGTEHSNISSARLLLEHRRLRNVETRDLQRRMTPSCIVHGDFHGRNVLVVGSGDRSSPRVIDLASMRRSIWATDLVRLFCDLFLSGWDSGTPSYEWTGLEGWVQLVDNLCSGDGEFISQAIVGASNRPVAVALDWLLREKLKIAGLSDETYHHAEFALCLGVEFLRASYRDRDLPAPKRALGLVAGNRLLEQANDLFQR